MRIEEVKTYSKAKKVGASVSKQFQKKAGKIIMGWIDKLENEFITKKLIRNEPGNRADFRSEALTLINQEMGSKWNSEQVADNFQIKGYDGRIIPMQFHQVSFEMIIIRPDEK